MPPTFKPSQPICEMCNIIVYHAEQLLGPGLKVGIQRLNKENTHHFKLKIASNQI